MMRRLGLIALMLCSTLACLSARADNSSDEYNFRFSPIGIFFGDYSATLDVGLSDNWTLGPSLRYHRYTANSNPDFTSDFAITLVGIGARANWFKNGIYTDGIYVAPALSYTSVTLRSNDNYGSVSGSANTLIASGLVGYGWFWNSFNIMLGIGAQVGIGPQYVAATGTSGYSTNQYVAVTAFTGEFTIGWTF